MKMSRCFRREEYLSVTTSEQLLLNCTFCGVVQSSQFHHWPPKQGVGLIHLFRPTLSSVFPIFYSAIMYSLLVYITNVFISLFHFYELCSCTSNPVWLWVQRVKRDKVMKMANIPNNIT